MKGGEEGEQRRVKAHGVCNEQVSCTCTAHVQHPIYQHTHMNNEAHCIAHYTGRRKERRDSNKEYTCTVQWCTWSDQMGWSKLGRQRTAVSSCWPSSVPLYAQAAPVKHIKIYLSKPLRLLWILVSFVACDSSSFYFHCGALCTRLFM